MHRDVQIAARERSMRSAAPFEPAKVFGWTMLAFAIVALAGCEQASDVDVELPGGGREYVLDYEQFETEIAAIFTANGCDNENCHGGGIRGTYELSPTSNKNTAFDFTQSALQVTPEVPADSPLLMKPLAESAGGAAHAGSPLGFDSIDDPDYQAVLGWIQAGEYR